jgi:glucose/arabinose dehydrogenase
MSMQFRSGVAVSVFAIAGFAGVAEVALAQGDAQVLATREHRVRLVTLTRGLEHPWGLAFLPDGRLLVTERPGRLRVVTRDGRLDATPVAGLPRVDAEGQGGLMDVALHPDYAKNGWIYWTYAQRNRSGNGTELARGRLAGGPGAYRMTDVQVLFAMSNKTGGGQHFGSRVVFDRQGLLYLTLGDRGTRDRAQRLDDHAGKILRLTDDGKPAPGNPFAGREGAWPEIFSLGNRNVQGAGLHPKTGALWAVEHGPQGGDELNLIRAGANYGWPVVTYGVNYVIGTKIGEGTAKPGMEPPVKYWVPSPAVAGMAFYAGDRFPRWRGDVLIAALRGQSVIRVRLSETGAFVEDEFMFGNVARFRHVVSGPDGYVYLLTDSSDGTIVRVEPAD